VGVGERERESGEGVGEEGRGEELGGENVGVGCRERDGPLICVELQGK
jgi:hypothetical protein